MQSLSDLAGLSVSALESLEQSLEMVRAATESKVRSFSLQTPLFNLHFANTYKFPELGFRLRFNQSQATYLDKSIVRMDVKMISSNIGVTSQTRYELISSGSSGLWRSNEFIGPDLVESEDSIFIGDWITVLYKTFGGSYLSFNLDGLKDDENLDFNQHFYRLNLVGIEYGSGLSVIEDTYEVSFNGINHGNI